MTLIFHLTAFDDWQAAQAAGGYRLSTRDRTLEEVGFIHASTLRQVRAVANAMYRGVHGLVLLVIDSDRLEAAVKEESADGGPGERYPHIYGALNLDAVIDVLGYEPGADGSFAAIDYPGA